MDEVIAWTVAVSRAKVSFNTPRQSQPRLAWSAICGTPGPRGPLGNTRAVELATGSASGLGSELLALRGAKRVCSIQSCYAAFNTRDAGIEMNDAYAGVCLLQQGVDFPQAGQCLCKYRKLILHRPAPTE